MPLAEEHQRFGIRLQRGLVVGNPVQHDRRDWKHHARRRGISFGGHMMAPAAVKVSVAVLERVHVNKSEGSCGGLQAGSRPLSRMRLLLTASPCRRSSTSSARAPMNPARIAVLISFAQRSALCLVRDRVDQKGANITNPPPEVSARSHPAIAQARRPSLATQYPRQEAKDHDRNQVRYLSSDSAQRSCLSDPGTR